MEARQQKFEIGQTVTLDELDISDRWVFNITDERYMPQPNGEYFVIHSIHNYGTPYQSTNSAIQSIFHIFGKRKPKTQQFACHIERVENERDHWKCTGIVGPSFIYGEHTDVEVKLIAQIPQDPLKSLEEALPSLIQRELITTREEQALREILSRR